MFPLIFFTALACNRVDFLRSLDDVLVDQAFKELALEDLEFLFWYRAITCETERTGYLKELFEDIEPVHGFDENSDFSTDSNDDDDGDDDDDNDDEDNEDQDQDDYDDDHNDHDNVGDFYVHETFCFFRTFTLDNTQRIELSKIEYKLNKFLKRMAKGNKNFSNVSVYA